MKVTLKAFLITELIKQTKTKAKENPAESQFLTHSQDAVWIYVFIDSHPLNWVLSFIQRKKVFVLLQYSAKQEKLVTHTPGVQPTPSFQHAAS